MALLVTSQLTHTVLEYNETTGVFVKVAASGGALGDPLGVVIGLDGNVLVSDGQTNQVKRYDKSTGAFIGVFASTNLSGPTGMTIHDGVLYVTNSNSPQSVQRFDATTGVNTGQFVSSLSNPSPRDVKVNPANNRLYVLYYNMATVETFDLTTMASLGLLMPAGSPLGSAVCIRRRPSHLAPMATFTSWRYLRREPRGQALQPDDRRVHRLLRQHRQRSLLSNRNRVRSRQQPLRRHSERRQCDALQFSNRDVHGLLRS
jgi:hypothetical protein